MAFKNILTSFLLLCVAVTLAEYDPTNGRFHYKCKKHSVIVSYDAPEGHSVSFKLQGPNPQYPGDFKPNVPTKTSTIEEVSLSELLFNSRQKRSPNLNAPNSYCTKDFSAAEKPEWEVNFEDCNGGVGQRSFDMDLKTYGKENWDSSRYRLTVNCYGKNE